ncbi:MAG TPA: PA14 domain-containing protein, partial [Gemmataceae bacterium]
EFSAKVPSILKGIKTRVDSTIDFKAEEFKADGAGVATELNATWSGTLIPQHSGRYRLVVERADNSDPTVLRVDGKTVLILDAKSPRSDVLLSLSDRPVAIGLSFRCLNTERHKLRLLWVPPGADTEEPIPPEMLYRERKSK